MQRFSFKLKAICGFSVLEILIALALGGLLLTCVFQVYLSTKSLSLAVADNAKLQNNLRFITHFLRRNIGMAGYSGCGQLKDLDLKNNTDFVFTAAGTVRGFSSDTAPRELKKYQIVPHTDLIVVQKADEGITSIDEAIKAGAKNFHVASSPVNKFNKTILLADCVNADLLTAIDTGATKLVRSSDKITHKYAVVSTTASRFAEIAYFISPISERSGDGGSGSDSSKYGLYYVTNYGNKMLLSDGISSMQIRYGVDSRGEGKIDNYYVAAEIDAGKLWDKINSVIITLTPSLAQHKPQTWDIYIKLRERSV